MPVEKKKKSKSSSTQSNKFPLLVFGKYLVVVVALAYVYGFVIVWTAYGTLGVIPYWFPVYRFLPSGLFFMLIAIQFVMLGITLGGEEVKMGSKDDILRWIRFIFSFVFWVSFIRLFLFEEINLIIKPTSALPSILFMTMYWIGVILFIVHQNSERLEDIKTSLITGSIATVVLILLNILIFKTIIVYLCFFCWGIAYLGMLFLTPSQEDVKAKRTTLDKLKSPLWVFLSLVVLTFSAIIFGNVFYFSLNPALGGGKFKTGFFICDTSENYYEAMKTYHLISPDCDRIEGSLIAETDDLYYILIKTQTETQRVIALEKGKLDLMIFGHLPDTILTEDSLDMIKEPNEGIEVESTK
ncbi:hypothetical protein ES705_34631 [subsurface metagenome]